MADRFPDGGVFGGTTYVTFSGGVGDMGGVGDLGRVGDLGGNGDPNEGSSVGEDGGSTSVDEISGDAATHD